MNEQIAFADLFERGLKRFDQRVGKLSQEADRVSQKNSLFVRQHQAARSRIQRGEKFVLGYNAGARQQIQQRRFSSVGVSDHSGDRPLMSFATFALYRARFAHRFQLAFQPRDPFLHATAINF